ncbi:MAG: glycosyltransferase family 2 protein [Bradymonadaceae bacterium]
MHGRSVEDPESDAFIGIGAFNLVKRSSFERTEGWEWLRMEVADDVGLGMMLARHDMKTRVLMSRELMHMEWYPFTRAMSRGLEKNAFPAIARYRLVRAMGFFGFWCLIFFGPIAALFHPSVWLTGLGAVSIGASIPVDLYAAWVLDRTLGPFLAAPVGQWLLMCVFLRSTYYCLRRGGVEWRGTTYPIEKLRRHQRLRL